MRLHHVAYVTRSIEERVDRLSSLLGCRPKGELVIDEGQGVRIQFVQLNDGSLIELLEPYGEKSPVERHLRKGGGIYHTCFEVSDLEGTLDRLRQSGDAIVVREPMPAPAISNRRVAFVVTADQDLFEFVECEA
ncbi:VOC family protein [Bradyrhizobium sp. WYCCWR 13023]|uniref:VOC family protein n=1 Tax=Bradyrhizobium zhengyangense TaxID=2911009 RepID=A0A9X1RJV4_9BRAD|nr:VOC family protein [Bradyrhizobium zhengyangense]MCG2632718.1 VOC family protein [Bradyrhizobium zhengyangense]